MTWRSANLWSCLTECWSVVNIWNPKLLQYWALIIDGEVRIFGKMQCPSLRWLVWRSIPKLGVKPFMILHMHIFKAFALASRASVPSAFLSHSSIAPGQSSLCSNAGLSQVHHQFYALRWPQLGTIIIHATVMKVFHRYSTVSIFLFLKDLRIHPTTRLHNILPTW